MDKSAREDCYQLALMLVRQIDDHLQRGYHYRTTTGQVITTLDQALVAIQNNQWVPPRSHPGHPVRPTPTRSATLTSRAVY